MNRSSLIRDNRRELHRSSRSHTKFTNLNELSPVEEDLSSVKYTVNNLRRSQFLMTLPGQDLPDHVHGIFRKYKNPVCATVKEHAPLVRQRSRSTIMASFPFLIVLATFKILGHYCRANGTLFR